MGNYNKTKEDMLKDSLEFYNKGIDLLIKSQEAFKRLDFDEADRLRQESNRNLDMAYMNDENTYLKTMMAYNECRNFGYIYNLINSNASRLLREDKNTFKGILKMIKENKNLRVQYLMFDKFLKCENTSPKDFVKNTVSMMPILNEAKSDKSNLELLTYMSKKGIDGNVFITESEKKTFDSINYLIHNKKTLNNVDECVNSENRIVEYINENVKPKAENNIDLDSEIERLENSMNDKLNEDEKNFLNFINSLNENKERHFNEMKSNVIRQLNEMSSTYENEDDRNELAMLIEKVSGKPFNEDNFISDMAELYEISCI